MKAREMSQANCRAAAVGALMLGLSTALPAFGVEPIKRPAETVQLKASPLAGYAVAQGKCAICHSADYIAYQPPGMTLKQWTAEMTKMQKLYGAPISDQEVQQVAAYLAVTYGSARADDADVVAASAAK